jgi:hypothetical protein
MKPRWTRAPSLHGGRWQRRPSVILAVADLVSCAAASACSSNTNAARPRPKQTTATTTEVSATTIDSLRSAASSYAKAYLTGTMSELVNSEGPKCHTPGAGQEVDEQVWAPIMQQWRGYVQHQLGVELTSIQIRRVAVRNVTEASGEAEVEYSVSPSVSGNYNWVKYERDDSQWKVADCRAPIGRSLRPGTPQHRCTTFSIADVSVGSSFGDCE